MYKKDKYLKIFIVYLAILIALGIFSISTSNTFVSWVVAFLIIASDMFVLLVMISNSSFVEFSNKELGFDINKYWAKTTIAPVSALFLFTIHFYRYEESLKSPMFYYLLVIPAVWILVMLIDGITKKTLFKILDAIKWSIYVVSMIHIYILYFV